LIGVLDKLLYILILATVSEMDHDGARPPSEAGDIIFGFDRKTREYSPFVSAFAKVQVRSYLEDLMGYWHQIRL